MNRYKEIDILKGIAITFVLLGHAIIFFPVNLHTIGWCSKLFAFVSTVHMSLFFAVSGFCFGIRGGYLNFIRKKVKRLVIPYFVFCFIDAFFRVLFPQFINRNSSISEIIKNTFLYGGELWFLYCLFIIFVIFPGIAFLYDRYRVSRLIIPVVLFGMILISPKVPSVLTLSNVFRYLFVFYLGFVVKKNLPLLSERWNRLKKYVPLLTVFSFVLWCGAVILICDVKDILLFRLLAGFFGMVSIISAVLRFSDSVLLKPFENIGKYSLQLYLLNGYTLTAARVIMVNLLGVTSALPIVAFNMVLTLGGSYLVIHFIIGKVKPFRFICGM